MKWVTGNIGKSHIKKAKSNTKALNVNHVLICRPNQRLGNLLLITPLLQEVITTFPECKIDIVVKGNMATQVFRNYKNVDKIIILPRKPFKELIKYSRVWFSIRGRKYDLVINAVEDSSSGKLLTKMAKSSYKVFGNFNEEPEEKLADRAHIAKSCIYNLRDYLGLLGHKQKTSHIIPKISLQLSEKEISEGKKIVDSIVDIKKRTLAIFTFATGKKCYSKEWWSKFYEKLKTEYSNYNILEVLPVENVSQIDFQALTFYSKDIHEIAAVIENTDLFIGADGGIMHLAAATSTPTAGLFSVTDHKKYGPYGGKNISVDTNSNDVTEWVEQMNKIF